MNRIAPLLALLLAAALTIPAMALASAANREQDVAIIVESNLFEPHKFVFEADGEIPDEEDLAQEYETQRLEQAFPEVWSFYPDHMPDVPEDPWQQEKEKFPDYMPGVPENPWDVTPATAPVVHFQISHGDEGFQEYGYQNSEGIYHAVGWVVRDDLGTIYLANEAEGFDKQELINYINADDIQRETRKTDLKTVEVFKRMQY